MSTKTPANSVVTSDTPPPKTGVSSGIRITTALLVASILGIFMLLWDSQLLPHTIFPDWIGSYIFTPLIAVILGFGSNCLIQQLSCGQVQWLNQVQRVMVIPLPFILVYFMLYILPGMRWPIEGLFQTSSPEMQKGLSSAFYTFWTGMYCQGLMNGLAQLCPK